MNRRLALVPLLAASVVGLAACSDAAVGSPSAAPPTSGQQSVGSAGPTSSGGSTGSAGTTALQPCDLASPAVISQLQVTKTGTETGSGARSCVYSKDVDANGLNGYSLGIDIRDSQGIKDVNGAGYTVTSDNIGRHQGKQLATNTGDCIVAIGVTDSSRVDVTVSAGVDTNQACQAANALAKSVEPKLPTGGN